MTENIAERIQTEIQRLFQHDSMNCMGFKKRIEKLHKTYGDPLYVDLLFAGAHLEFAPRTAKKHYHNILSHWEILNKLIRREIDFKVALLDYFVSVNRRIKNPTIIELKILRKTQQEIETDELTKLFNFRFLEKQLDIEVSRAIRYNAPLSLVFLDVDDFKFYNDRNGHLAGNKALKKLGRILQQGVRNVDVPARFGGEEFALLLPETQKEGALVIADRIRQAVEDAKFSFATKQPMQKFTVSGGIASLHLDADNSSDLIKKADQALYQAKAHGKNQVALYITEKRACDRVPTSMAAQISSAQYANQVLLLQDISESGFAFHFDKPLAKGEIIDLGLEFPGRKARIKCTVEIRRVRQLHGDSKYEIGASIIAITPSGKKAVVQFIQSHLP